MDYSIFENTFTPLPHIESLYLVSLRKFLKDINGALLLDNDHIQNIQRKNNVFLIKIAVNSIFFGIAGLKYINYCRLYLGVALFLILVLSMAVNWIPIFIKTNRYYYYLSLLYELITKQNLVFPPGRNSENSSTISPFPKQNV